jgi:hypothetical protein
MSQLSPAPQSAPRYFDRAGQLTEYSRWLLGCPQSESERAQWAEMDLAWGLDEMEGGS